VADDVTVTRNDAEWARLFGPAGELAKVLARAGVRVETKAKQRCPVDTGRLRSSISSQLDISEGVPAVVIGTDVEYAIYVELGTSRMAARPFLRSSVTEVIAEGLT
jgi:HK97 gp10 family phage protein